MIHCAKGAALFGKLLSIDEPKPYGVETDHTVKMGFIWKEEVIDGILFAKDYATSKAFKDKFTEGAYYLLPAYKVQKPKYEHEYVTNHTHGMVFHTKSMIIELPIRERYLNNTRITQIDRDFARHLPQPKPTMKDHSLHGKNFLWRKTSRHTTFW